jgi:hypothetical protein
MIHKIKVDEETFAEIVSSGKKYVIRPNDKRYRVGDVLVFCEISDYTFEYTGRERRKRVLLAVDDKEVIKEGFVLLFVESTTKGSRRKTPKKESKKA